MKTKALLVSVSPAALALVGSAGAADLPIKARPVVDPAFSWTGCYVGGHVGYGWGRQNAVRSSSALLITGPNEITGANATASSAIDTHGGVFGGQVGCNYQFASNWVVGVEGSLSGTDVKGSITDPIFGSGSFISVKTDVIGSAVARLGFTAMNNHALFYVKGGIAGERNKWSSSPLGFLGAEDRLGWTAGAGVEWAFTRVWSVFLDYSHYEFGQNGGTFTVQNSFFGGPIFLSSDSLTSTGGHLDVVKVGVNLKLFGR